MLNPSPMDSNSDLKQDTTILSAEVFLNNRISNKTIQFKNKVSELVLFENPSGFKQ